MKRLMTTLFVLLSVSVSQAYPLLQGIRAPGFEMHRRMKTFVLDSSGEMTLKIEDYEPQVTRTIRLGQLAPDIVTAIRNTVEQIGVAVPLEDQEPGGPICADIPEYTVSVNKSGKMKTIYQAANCHTSKLRTLQGDREIHIALGFLEY